MTGGDFSRIKSFTYYDNIDDILYYEIITVENLEKLKNKFICACL